MKFRFVLPLTIFLILGSLEQGFAQFHQQPAKIGRKEGQKDATPVLFRAYPVMETPQRFKVYLIANVVYDLMQFVVENKEYHAACEFEALFTCTDTKKIYSRLWKSEAVVANYRTTNRRDLYHVSIDSITLPPGEYVIQLDYRDLNGRIRFQQKFSINMEPPAGDYFAPPLLLEMRPGEESLSVPFPYRPLAMISTLPFNRQLGVLLQGQFVHPVDTLRIRFRITPEISENQPVTLDTTVSFAQATRWRMVLQPPFQKLFPGKHELSISYQWDSQKEEQHIPFTVSWQERPRSLADFDYALKALKFALDKDQYKALFSGNKKEKRKAFFQYWHSLDPTPETAYNELMVEFYQRVDSTDLWWGKKGRYGWRTDPGKIYLLYGRPNQIIDRSLDPERPYMEWIYELPDRRLRFRFQALEGRRLYKLISQKEEPKS